LVLLHGLTSRWQGWEFMLPHLTPTWHVYACDLRGHGKSGRAAGGYRLPDYARDIAVFLRDRVGVPATLLGHSLGALTALAAASQVPDYVRALALIDPPLYSRNLSVNARPAARDWFGWVYETVTSARTYADVVARCREMLLDADEASLLSRAEAVYRVAPGAVKTVLHDRLFDGMDLERVLQQIECPALFLRGEWERGSAMRDEDADFVRAQIPAATILQIPNTGHRLHSEQTETLLENLRAFLQPA
jgi:pimeloyl-ACP methyl ester carboxylesterase